MKSKKGMSPAAIMMLVCMLPLAFFFILAAFNVHVSPMLAVIIVIFCCLMMQMMMGGSEEYAGCHGRAADEEKPASVSIEFPANVNLDDLFQSQSTETAGGEIVMTGSVLGSTEETAQTIQSRVQGSGFTVLLQEDELNRTRLVLIPVELKQIDTKPRNNYNSSLSNLKIVSQTN